MAEEQDKFLVLNRKFLKNLKPEEQGQLFTLLDKAGAGDRRYWCCNQDEPYASEVRESILRGETAKEQLEAFKADQGELRKFNVYLYRNVFFRVDGVEARSFAEAADKAVHAMHGQYDDHLRRGGDVGNVQDADEGLGVLVDLLNKNDDVEDEYYMPDWALYAKEGE